MKLVAPESFTYEAGERAVLLLHGFTGSPLDVRKLGRYLQDRGYTCHAPLYKGHGVDPKELIPTGPVDWWQDVKDGYQFLREKGYKKIAVAGISLGGVFALKVGLQLPVTGIISMSAPIIEKSREALFKRVLTYARGYKRFEGKEEAQISDEMKELEQTPMKSLKNIQNVIRDVATNIHFVNAPLLVIQGCLDEDLYHKSAQKIYESVSSKDKHLKWFEESGHMITLDKEREKVYKTIEHFLDELDW